MTLRDRSRFDAGGTRVEDALRWAADNGFHYMDFNADRDPNSLLSWSDERVRAVRDICQRHDIHLGLHTLSAVNIAEFSPYVSEGADEYLRASIDFAARLGCRWIDVQGNIDSGSLFRRLEATGYTGHYSMAFGSSEDKLRARDFFIGLV